MEYKKQYQSPQTELVKVLFEANILSNPYGIPGYGDSNELNG